MNAFISRRSFLRHLGLGAALLGAQSFFERARAEAVCRPNILYIMSDDHASSAIGAYGGFLKDVAPTKNIDRLAREGIRLDNCFVTNSICTPSRGAILTGQYSHRTGIYTLNDAMPKKREHVAHLLQQGGYQTAIFGKWLLQNDPEGFDDWEVLPGQGVYHDPKFISKTKGEVEYKGRYSEDVIGDLTLNWLKSRDTSRPFFLMCHFKAPHRSWQPAERFRTLFADRKMPEPENLLDDYKNRSKAAANAKLKVGADLKGKDVKTKIPEGMTYEERTRWAYQLFIKDYLRCVAAVNENVGRLLDYLDAENLAKNTLVIYTSDQGVFVGEHGYFDKRFMYEESLRMPFIARLPGEIAPGSVNKDMILNVDFAPTFLEFAGAPVLPEMQGRSFRSNLAGKTPPDWRKSMYYRYWMHLAGHNVPAHYGVRTDRYKLIFFYGLPLGAAGAVKEPTEPEWELFDLEKDPCEMRNVYRDPAYAETVKALKAELARLKKELGDTDEKYPELMEVRRKYWDS